MVESLIEPHLGTAVAHLGIEFLEAGDDSLHGRVPIGSRSIQPMRLSHRGISVVPAETLGSCDAVSALPIG